MNKAVANLAAELAKMKMAKELTEELESPEIKTPRRLEAAGDNMVSGSLGEHSQFLNTAEMNSCVLRGGWQQTIREASALGSVHRMQVQGL